MKRYREYIFIVLLMGVLVVAGVWLYRIWDNYRAPGKEYEELRQYVKETPAEEIPEDPHANDKMQGESEGEEIEIDFEKLRQINPDIVAWIRIEAAGIDYPVVQGSDNEFYLHHTFTGKKSMAGSIFMDYRNQKDVSDEKVIIYGHNMRDGSMFAKLKDFVRYVKPIVVLYTPTETLQYQLFEEKSVSPIDEIYNLEVSEIDQYDKYETIEEKQRILILSTCNNVGSNRHVFLWKILPK